MSCLIDYDALAMVLGRNSLLDFFRYPTCQGNETEGSVPDGSLALRSSEDGWVVTGFFPGITNEDVDISIKDGFLSIAINKTLTTNDGIPIKRTYDIRNSWRIDKVATDKITASIKDDVLTVSLPSKSTTTKIKVLKE